MPAEYEIEIKRSAEKELNALPAPTRLRIVKRLLSFENDPRPRGVVKLQGQEAYRMRMGVYRALFTIDDVRKIVVIYAVGHRRDVYR